MNVRKIFFWLHLAVGATGGIVILIMSVTGVLLMYEKQVTEWADLRQYQVAPPSPGETRLPMEGLLGKIREQRSALPSVVNVRSDPAAPVEAAFGREVTIYVNPYTGQVMGEGSRQVRDFFRAITGWHRWLAAEEGRDTSRAITGACNLGFLFIVTSGFYLWWPKKWTIPNLRSVTWFRRGLPGKARDFNWHNVIGLWCAVPLFFIVLGAVFISYPWATDLLYRATGAEPAARPIRPSGGPGAGPHADLSLSGLDSLWARAEQHVSGWRSIGLRLPSSERAPVVFTINQGYGGQPQKRTTLSLDRETGRVIRSEGYGDMIPAQRARTWFRFVHTGEYYGIVGQTLAGIASAGAAVLVYTGFSLALRRFWAWRGRRRRASRLPGRADETATAESPAGIGSGSLR